jgi:SAM-dependent methyltransferase
VPLDTALNVKPSTASSPQEAFSPKVYWENRLSHNFSLGGVGHGLFGYHYNHWLYKLRDRVLRRHLAKLELELSDANILDVGSGTGFYIDFWRSLGVGSISGSDLTEVSVCRLRERFPDLAFHQLDIGGELSPDLLSKADIVSAFDVLFHIVDDARFERAIRNISQLLKLGGVFCFSDLFLHGKAEISTHMVCRPLSHVEEVLARFGFETILRRPVFVVMNQPLDTRTRLPRFAWALMTYPARWSEAIGWFYGALLYPVDVVLTKFLKESPTAEMMICRKIR